MADPDVLRNCPRCGKPLAYRTSGIGSHTKGDVTVDGQVVHQFFCQEHGFYVLGPDGRLKYQPSSHRTTERADLE